MPFYLFLLSNFFFWLGDNLLLLSEDHLNVAGGAHVGVDPPVSSVGAPAHFGSLVHLDVLNHQRIHIETLGGIKLKHCASLLPATMQQSPQHTNKNNHPPVAHYTDFRLSLLPSRDKLKSEKQNNLLHVTMEVPSLMAQRKSYYFMVIPKVS